MKIPKYILEILNKPYKFSFVYFSHLKQGKKSEDAYDDAVAEIKEFIPNFEPLREHDTELRKYYLNKELIEIPNDVIAAVCGGFDDLMDEFYKKDFHRKKAYDDSIAYINKYVPTWKPAASYESYKSGISLRYKKLKQKQHKRRK
jgi:hypothetical protein